MKFFAMDFQPGSVFGGYRIVDSLGEGSMGKVYLGMDIQLGREVAIKVLRSEISRSPESLERFRKEAVALAKLNHGNICSVYAFVETADASAIVLQFLKGQALSEVIQTGRALQFSEVCSIASDILQGLVEAHSVGVVHRDLKPANIIVSDSGRAVITDFGIAKMMGEERATKVGFMVGTLEYASPEQIMGLDVDLRSDIYSLGVIVYELLIGVLPFRAKSDYELMRQKLECVPDFSKIDSDFGKRTTSFLRRALSKDASARYNSAAEMLDALQQLQVGLVRVGSSAKSFSSRPIEKVVEGGSQSDVADEQVAVRPRKQRKYVQYVSAFLVSVGVAFYLGSLLKGPSTGGLGANQILNESNQVQTTNALGSNNFDENTKSPSEIKALGSLVTASDGNLKDESGSAQGDLVSSSGGVAEKVPVNPTSARTKRVNSSWSAHSGVGR